jgi:flagella basal body P-ring formation protein FlgA
MRRIDLLILALALAAPPCLAQAAPTLRPEIAITSDIVRIGDLVTDAGELADIAVFRAPDLGHVGTVAARQVLDALRQHGLEEVMTLGINEVTVTRLSRHFSTGEIQQRIAAALAGQRGLGSPDDLSLTFDREVRPLHVNLAAGDLTVASASFDPRSRRFDVTLATDGSATPLRLRHTGTLVETTPTAVLVRPLGRGDVIRASDIVIERRPRSNVPSGALDQPEQLVGMAARRPLTASQPLRAADLMKPELVRQNETVTMLYQTPGLALSVRGKALESGADGDLINVLNIQSKRTVQGTVVGPGRVMVMVMTPQIISADSRATRPAVTAAAKTSTANE